ncbi:MAG: hypothetical protein WBE73_14285 [Candidatus Acidiferrum sp.]
MSASAKASASVIVAGVVAILGSVIVLAGAGLSLGALLLVKMPATMPEQPPFVRIAGITSMAIGIVCAIFGIATGIGLFLLRNWARISAMVWAGICFFFGIIGIPVALFMSLPAAYNSGGMPENFTFILRLVLLAVYGAPLAVGIWWLVLFNRKSVKEQFAGTAEPIDPSLPQKPRAPLAVSMLAWFFITTAANIIILPFLPFPAPAILFGRLIEPPAGTLILILICIAIAIAGIGLLKLKPWSYSLTIGLQLFGLTSGVASLLTPGFSSSFDAAILKMNEAMRLPINIDSPINYAQLVRWGMVGGIVLGVAILVILLYYRERFLEAASAAKG